MKEAIRAETTAKSLVREVVKPATPAAYQELNAPARDVLRQLEANLTLLEDLHGRLRFMMSEVRILVNR